ncbi:hypothetical protein [Myxococcus phage Mx1]|nr:hypothetical protein [Myxococcus phage Mx1]
MTREEKKQLLLESIDAAQNPSRCIYAFDSGSLDSSGYAVRTEPCCVIGQLLYRLGMKDFTSLGGSVSSILMGSIPLHTSIQVKARKLLQDFCAGDREMELLLGFLQGRWDTAEPDEGEEAKAWMRLRVTSHFA